MTYLVFAISLLFYSCLLVGIFLTFEDPFRAIASRLTIKRREVFNKRKESSAVLMLSRLVFSSTGKENKGALLLSLEIIIIVFVFMAANVFYTFFTSLIIALLAASVPILSLVSNTQKLRNRSSLEGPGFVADLYRQYRINDKNIYSAMECVSKGEKEYPLCAKQIYLLLLRLRSSGSTGIIEEACADFSFSLGTSWGKTLSSCIKAACGGTDISEALVDIMHNLKIAKEEHEQKKRLNSEALRMTVLLVPLMYAATMLMAVKYLGMDIGKLLRNQFMTPEGVLLFFLIAFLFFANTIILSLITNDALDL